MTDSQAAAPREDTCYEDVIVGDEFETGSHTVTMDDIRTFGAVTRDRHPLHMDEAFCKRTRFGRPIAHGLYGLALMEGLKAETKLYEHTSIASLGWDKVRFKAPVFPGDTVRARVRFIDKRETRKPDRGVVRELVILVNQNDTVVIEAEHATLLWHRSAAPAAAG